MRKTISRLAALGVATLLSTAGVAAPIYTPGDLTFTTENQSMWGPGDAFQLDETYFVGATWNESASFGSINNFPGTGGTIVNPLRVTYDAAYATCRLTLSHNTCVNGGSRYSGLGRSATCQDRQPCFRGPGRP